jgi:hypothetical protein
MFLLCSLVGDMQYKVWRSNTDVAFHVLCRGHEFESLPQHLRSCGPWIGSREGEVERLKPPYRALLEEQAFVVIYSAPSKLALECG